MSPLATYYVVYLVACASVILILGRILHSSGLVVLRDAFSANPTLVSALSRLLDLGFYLLSLGYAAATYYPWLAGTSFDYDQVVRIIITKLGWFLLVLGPAHLVNLLILALFRRRPAQPAGAVS
ncbi:MAG TPA: hypothetical protein VE291_09020 [Terracidiphilus sp.]|jgi:hypothetical protein|nr:hypothetical protein [Terracidiphilus sp.]